MDTRLVILVLVFMALLSLVAISTSNARTEALDNIDCLTPFETTFPDQMETLRRKICQGVASPHEITAYSLKQRYSNLERLSADKQRPP